MKFGISNNVRSRVVRVCTPELFRQATQSRLAGEVCAAIEDALEKVRRGEMSREEYDVYKAEQKKRLPIFTPHATFRNGRRLNADAVPSGLSMYDIDHIADPRGHFERIVKHRTQELGIVLAHVTPSTEGLRLFFVIPKGMDLASAQAWMSRQLGDKTYDQSVKDYARSSFVVPTSYILYIDEARLFGEETPGKSETSQCAVLPEMGTEGSGASSPNGASGGNIPQSGASGESNASGKAESGANFQESGVSDTNGSTSQSELPTEQARFKGIPYTEIIRQWFRLMGGEPVQGERNDKLHRLASHLRYITDNDEEIILSVIPRYGLADEEVRALVHSACTARFCSMPKVMEQALKQAGISARKAMVGDAEACTHGEPNLNLPPEMPHKLPSLIELLTSRTPDIYKPAVAHAVFPSLGAHLWRVRFKYIDNIEHEATLMNVLMAGTGAGKDCISEPINRIMADIRRRDEENLQREREWKNEVTLKGANKDRRQRPEGLVIQEIDADMTNPAFVMRTAEADGHFLYTKMNEIDQFDALRGGGGSRSSQQFQIMCLAFDPNNRYGQTRVSAQSVTEKVTIRFNWNACTTIQKGQRYFSRVLTDGPISRINFCTIPEREIGADMPVYGSYGAEFDEELRPYIENLTHASGLVECPQAFRLANTLRDENADFARLSQSRVYENLSFRANVIAYLKACVLYVANGYRWEKPIEDFIRWSLRYDLWCKMEFFGEAIEQTNLAAEQSKLKKGPMNLLDLLPERFTLQEAAEVRRKQEMGTEGTRNMLKQWTYRGYIAPGEEGTYIKTNLKKGDKK